MRLVAASRTLNEDDILEAFVRHHAGMVDHHIFLDNGSTDRTLAILKALQAEGLPLTVLQSQAAHFCETQVLTALFGMAARMAADWVLMLDADEFIDQRAAAGGLRGVLAGLPAEQAVLRVRTAAYHPMPEDDAAELVVPRRIRSREPELQQVAKVIARGGLANWGVAIGAGSHYVLRDGQRVASTMAENLAIAHYQRRSPFQQIAKNAIGRLKVIAAGQTAEAGASAHYNQVFEALRDDPASLVRNPAFLVPGPPKGGLIDDPIEYLGGPLRHTEPADPLLKALSSLAAYGEALANQHARLVDANEGVRLQVHNLSLTWTRLF
jgi:hypothetical protein